MNIKTFLTTCFVAAIAIGGAFAYSAEPAPCAAVTICKCEQCQCCPCVCKEKCRVPVYEPAPCAPVETLIEPPAPEPCAPAVAVPTCAETSVDKQNVACRGCRKIRKKIVNKKKRCFFLDLKEDCEYLIANTTDKTTNKCFSFSLSREVKVEKAS